MDVQCDADINEAKTQIRLHPDIQNVHLIRDGPFNLQGGYGFLFRSEFFFRTTPELEYLFFCRAQSAIFLPRI